MAHNSYFYIEIQKGSNGLVTTRSLSQTLIVLISTLLGSVFGIMSSVGQAMALVESRLLNQKQKTHTKSQYETREENAISISRACSAEEIDKHKRLIWSNRAAIIDQEKINCAQ